VLAKPWDVGGELYLERSARFSGPTRVMPVCSRLGLWAAWHVNDFANMCDRSYLAHLAISVMSFHFNFLFSCVKRLVHFSKTS
jgi:hypothetical protein